MNHLQKRPLFRNHLYWLTSDDTFYLNHFLGCCCASASVHIDPDHPQQVARWLRGSRGMRVFAACINVHVYYECVCVCVSTDSHSLTALPSPPSRQCVGYSISQFEPSYTISGPWWLSWAGCWGRSTAPSHRPQLWIWHGRYAPADQSLNKNIIPPGVVRMFVGSDVNLSLRLA